MLLIEGDVLHFHFLVQEEAGTLTEFGGRLRREVLAGAASGEAFIHLGVTTKIVLKAGSDVLTLGNDSYGVRGMR